MRGVIRRVAAAAGLAVGASAQATWSIIIIDTRTGEVAVGSATCLTNFDLQANTPVLLTGIGAATAQSFVDSTGQNRVFIRDQLLLRTPPPTIVDLLAGFDASHQNKQYGIADTLGGTATFSGNGAGRWKGGQTGQVGDLVYAVQGNVLTGEPVVTAAVQAIIDTPGDLAAKLMASMEAARAMGGDGRCSCRENDPEGCGSPPDDFEKSAHIAYMLIARAGDTDGCNGVYRTASSPWDVVSGDFIPGGLIDLAVSNSSNNSVSIVRNVGAPGEFFSRFNSLPTNYPVGTGARQLVAGDFTGDGALDLAVACFTADTVHLLRANGDGTFAPSIALDNGANAPDGPQGITAGDFDGDGRLDLATANTNDDSITVYLNTASGFMPPIKYLVGDRPIAIATADLDGDGDLDLATCVGGMNRIDVLTNEGGLFLSTFALDTGAEPNHLVAADLDNDGDADLASANRVGLNVTIHKRDGATFTRADIPMPSDPRYVGVQDADGDGWPELFVQLRGARSFAILHNDAGEFTPAQAFATDTSGLMAFGDFNADGEVDIATAAASRNAVVVIDQHAGRFNDTFGCATGDTFMEFNVAFQSQLDPDPVYTLRAMFDAWREGLLGRPDAVQTIATLDREIIAADGVSRAVLTIHPRDWRGEPASAIGAEVTHDEAGDGVSAIGPVVANPDGSFSVELAASDERGVDRFRITLDDGVRPVVLMPAPRLVVALDPDANGDGVLNIFDFLAFQTLFGSEDPSADVDADGDFDLFDYLAFLSLINR